MNEYSRNSSMRTGELAQRMLSAWKIRTWGAGARDSHSQREVRRSDTLSRLSRVML